MLFKIKAIMKSIWIFQPRQFTGHKFAIYGLFIALFSLSACSKDYLAPESEEDGEELAPDYRLLNIEYFLGEGDGIDTATIENDPEIVTNHTDDLIQYEYIESWDHLTKTSRFKWDQSGTDLPKDLDLSSLQVSVPSDYFSNGDFGYYPGKFPLSLELQEEADAASNTKTTLDLKVPAQSQITILSSIEQYNMVCSFKATIRNHSSGITYTVTGKWEGNLRYNESKISLEEDPLN